MVFPSMSYLLIIIHLRKITKILTRATARVEGDGRNESGIEGILTSLEKQRNLSLGISLREKGKSNGSMYDMSPNGSVPWSSVIVDFKKLTVEEVQVNMHKVCIKKQNSFQEREA
ncbi:hypothetical protein YC2023_090102 [Brassica napus]